MVTAARLAFVLSSSLVVGCGGDPNERPAYGDTGLPKNCRAIVQANIDAYRTARMGSTDFREVLEAADGVIASLERNCGANGYSWGK